MVITSKYWSKIQNLCEKLFKFRALNLFGKAKSVNDWQSVQKLTNFVDNFCCHNFNKIIKTASLLTDLTEKRD